MTIFSELGVTASYLGPTLTVASNCFDKDPKAKGIKKEFTNRKFNDDKAEETIKKAGLTTTAVSVTSSLQNCSANHTIRNAEMYMQSLSDTELYELDQLLAAKETEFSINGQVYDLAALCQSDDTEVTKTSETVKLIEKRI